MSVAFDPDYALQPMRGPAPRRCEAHDGATLEFRHWPAEGPRRGVLLVLHEAAAATAEGLEDYDVVLLDRQGMRGRKRETADFIRDLQTLTQHLARTDGIAAEETVVIGEEIGALLAAAWVHDYAPPLRALILAAPAFAPRGALPAALGGYASELQADLRETAARIHADAAAIRVPTQLLIDTEAPAGARTRQHRFYCALGTGTKERRLVPARRRPLLAAEAVRAEIARFVETAAARPEPRTPLIEADRYGPAREEADRLASPLPAASLDGLRWAAARAGVAIGSRLSAGMRLGRKAGFDSGAVLDYVYRDRATGLGPLGRVIDRTFLDAIGWRGIRQRRRHLEAMLADALLRLADEGRPRHVLDIAAGHGRYVLGMPAEALALADSVLLRDYCPDNVAAGRRLIAEAGLEDRARFDEGDAFDAESLAAIAPGPTLAIVSGLYELYDANAPIRASLGGLARAVPPGGYLVYTNQPWHPQLEFIARALRSHRGGAAWVMRRRSQAEMDALVAEAGFEKLDQRIDRWGIFTVSLARRRTA
ncbi:MAG: class I SAM-dependent methyltransferase family protein [Pseudomonadota bacterium]